MTALTVMQVLAHGSSPPSGSTGAAAHATTAKMVCQSTTGCQESLTSSGDHSPISAEQHAALGEPTASVSGNTAGSGDLFHIDVHRRFHAGVERNMPKVLLVLQHIKLLIQGRHVLVKD